MLEVNLCLLQTWCEFWNFSVSHGPKHTHTPELCSGGASEWRRKADCHHNGQDVCGDLLMLCLWERPCLADGVRSVRVRRGLLFITDSTHRLHKAASICILRSCFGHLVKQAASVKHVLGSIDFSGIRNMLDIKCGLVQVADLRLGGSG